MPGKSKEGGGLEVKSTYKMKYQGKHSAFPFKSPLKDGTEHDHPHDRLKDEDGNEIPASGLEGAVIVDGKATFPDEPKG